MRGGEGAKPSSEVEQCGQFPNCIRFDGLLNILQILTASRPASVCALAVGEMVPIQTVRGRMEFLLT